eukprot:Selendium_serpulae@DN5444_c0_g1_i2.p1
MKMNKLKIFLFFYVAALVLPDGQSLSPEFVDDFLDDEFRNFEDENVRKSTVATVTYSNRIIWQPHTEAQLRGLKTLFGSLFGGESSANDGPQPIPFNIVKTVLKETGRSLPPAGPVNPNDVYKAEAQASMALLKAMKANGSFQRAPDNGPFQRAPFQRAPEQAVVPPIAAVLDPAELNPVIPGQTGNSELLPPVPPDTLTPPEGEPTPTEPMDELQEKIDYLEAQNLTQNFFDFLGEIAVPIDATKGINDVTAKLQALLPQEVRDAIVEATPNIGKHDLYESMNNAWQNYILYSDEVKENSVAREYLEAPRAAADLYNEYALWRYNAPWEVYDTKALSRQTIRQPLRDDRLEWIEKRDELLAAKNAQQEQFWSPAVTIAVANRNQLQMAVDDKNEVANNLILHEYGTMLEAIRAGNDVRYIFRTVILSGVVICLLNPQCCEAIEACPPLSITQPF